MSRIEAIGLLQDFGVDVVTKTLYLQGEVNQLLLQKLIIGLSLLSRRSYNRSGEPITIVLTTEGGESDVAFAMYDLIKNNPVKARTVVLGPCYSAGTLILQAGFERAMHENSSLMIHYGAEMVESKEEKRFLRQQDATWVGIFLSRCKEEYQAQVKSWHDAEKFLTAKEALQAGIVDKLV